MCVCVHAKLLQSSVTSCNPVVHLAPLSMGFSRQEYWSSFPFPSPGNLPDPGREPGSPTLQADFFFTIWTTREDHVYNMLMGSSYLTQGVQPYAPWQPRGVRSCWGWEGDSRGEGYMYTCGRELTLWEIRQHVCATWFTCSIASTNCIKNVNLTLSSH